MGELKDILNYFLKGSVMVTQKTILMCLCVFLAAFLGSAKLAVGSVLMSYWEVSPTTTLDEAISITRAVTPTATITLSSMDFPGFTPDKNDYVAKYTGWIVPPETGDYIFNIATDNDGGFWLSSDAAEPNVVSTATTPPLCRVTGNVAYRQFFARPEQQSPPINLQAGQAYGFTIIQREGGGGDHAALGWTVPGEEGITVVEARYFTNERKTGGPLPPDGAVDVRAGLLSWLAPAKLSGTANLTYDVYFGTDANLPAPYLKASGLTAKTYNTGAVNGSDLLFGKTYYWRINVSDPNIGGTPVYSVGDVWSFTTNDGKPFIVTAPTNVFGVLNDSAAFTVVADTLAPTPLFYQWELKAFPDSTWMEINGATEPTYSKTGLQPSDRGLYRVTISDLFNNSITAEARLYMRVGLVNRYSFTDNVNDSVGGAHGTLIVGNPSSYPAMYENATGTSGDPAKRQLYLFNGPTTPTSGSGNNCYVRLPSGFVSSIGKQMTLIVWFTWRATTDQNFQGVFNFHDGTSNNYLTLTPRSDSRTPRFAYRTPAEQRFLFSPVPIPLTAARQTMEHCFAITWNEDTGTTEMYVNGKRVSSNNIHLKLSENLNDINNWLGRQVANGDPAFWGAFNEFRVYDVALGAPTIYEAYLLGPDVLPNNPCVIQPAMDLDNDCEVNMNDFALLASEWLACGLTTCN
jgi:hypothetical protein